MKDESNCTAGALAGPAHPSKNGNAGDKLRLTPDPCFYGTRQTESSSLCHSQASPAAWGFKTSTQLTPNSAFSRSKSANWKRLQPF